jgi:hypothetical protein
VKASKCIAWIGTLFWNQRGPTHPAKGQKGPCRCPPRIHCSPACALATDRTSFRSRGRGAMRTPLAPAPGALAARSPGAFAPRKSCTGGPVGGCPACGRRVRHASGLGGGGGRGAGVCGGGLGLGKGPPGSLRGLTPTPPSVPGPCSLQESRPPACPHGLQSWHTTPQQEGITYSDYGRGRGAGQAPSSSWGGVCSWGPAPRSLDGLAPRARAAWRRRRGRGEPGRPRAGVLWGRGAGVCARRALKKARAQVRVVVGGGGGGRASAGFRAFHGVTKAIRRGEPRTAGCECVYRATKHRLQKAEQTEA